MLGLGRVGNRSSLLARGSRAGLQAFHFKASADVKAAPAALFRAGRKDSWLSHDPPPTTTTLPDLTTTVTTIVCVNLPQGSC